jgi:hypothetical protein
MHEAHANVPTCSNKRNNFIIVNPSSLAHIHNAIPTFQAFLMLYMPSKVSS